MDECPDMTYGTLMVVIGQPTVSILPTGGTPGATSMSTSTDTG